MKKSVSLWEMKPWWCQPWSILLTGAIVVAGSWVLLQNWWVTAPAALGVLTWWLLFLIVVPAGYEAELRAAQESDKS
jgi:membrane protein YdbS with pleckstrin-like domain